MQIIAVLFSLIPLASVLLLAIAWLLRRATPAFAIIENVTLSGGSGIPAVGTVLAIGVQVSPLSYLAIGNLGNLDWPIKRAVADTTNMGTIWKQSIGTLLDGGVFTADMHYIPGSVGIDPSGAFGHNFQTGLGSYFVEFNTLLYFSLTFPGGQQIYFTGHITEFNITMNLEKDLMAKISIQVSGQPVFLSA